MTTVHDLLVGPFSYEFMRRGLFSAMLLGVSGGLLGCVLILRRLALSPSGVLAGVSYGDIDAAPGRVWTLTPQQDGTYTYKDVGRGAPSRNPENVVHGRGGNLFGAMTGGNGDSGALFEVLQ